MLLLTATFGSKFMTREPSKRLLGTVDTTQVKGMQHRSGLQCVAPVDVTLMIFPLNWKINYEDESQDSCTGDATTRRSRQHTAIDDRAPTVFKNFVHPDACSGSLYFQKFT